MRPAFIISFYIFLSHFQVDAFMYLGLYIKQVMDFLEILIATPGRTSTPNVIINTGKIRCLEP